LGAQQIAQNDADAKEIASYRLTMETVDKMFNDAKTLDEMEKAVRQEPLLSGALAKAGMPPREFAKFTFAMVGASLAAGMQKAGMLKELPKEVNAENVKFILEHEAELQKLQQEMKGLEK
jgi:hypothetical protein